LENLKTIIFSAHFTFLVVFMISSVVIHNHSTEMSFLLSSYSKCEAICSTCAGIRGYTRLYHGSMNSSYCCIFLSLCI